MNRALSQWIFGVVDDTARSALMLMLAGAAISLQQRSRSQLSRLPLISSPILSFGVAVGSVAKPAVREVKAARPSKLRFLSRMST